MRSAVESNEHIQLKMENRIMTIRKKLALALAIFCLVPATTAHVNAGTIAVQFNRPHSKCVRVADAGLEFTTSAPIDVTQWDGGFLAPTVNKSASGR